MTDDVHEAAKATEKAIECSGCHQPLKPDERVYAGPYFEMRASSSGKGTYRQNIGKSVTHAAHWPPLGGVTHDIPAPWAGFMKDLPEEYRS